jgi:S-adenosylmethionine:tRNA ribosyltransferase-isomerase
MRTKSFSFDLPEELIAQHPPAVRGSSRLLLLHRKSGNISHSTLKQIHTHIKPGAVMVFNDSKVRKARLFAKSEHGGTVELLLVKRLKPSTWLAITSKARRQRLGKTLMLPEGVTARVIAVDGQFRTLEFSPDIDEKWLDAHGHIPLPPYISRPDDKNDAERYQTVYSNTTGSVAAPTAGLHFTRQILSRLEENNVELRFLTLHVGAGTFFPIRSESIEDHRMHEEHFEISAGCSDAINRAKSEGRSIVAVGTTTLRCLESATDKTGVRPGEGSTELYITPGYRFKTVNALFTNFHTPESTLMVLVSAFAGLESIQGAYREAIEQRYRFFSYGDAMLIQ